RVRDGEVQVRRLRGVGKQIPVDLESPFVLPEPDERQCVKRSVVAIVAIDGEEPHGLAPRLEEQVALGKDLRILEPRQIVIRRKLEDSFEQQLCVVEYVAFQSDAGEQTHRLDVITMPAKI